MNKATIISLDKKWAYIFTQDCGLRKIAANADMSLGQEILLPEKQTFPAEQTRTEPARLRRLRPALIALSLILLVSMGVWFGVSPLTQPVYATVSIDVNPSLQLNLNQDLVVTTVNPMNDEARQLLSGIKLKGMDWQEAVYRWSEQLGQHYQTDMVLVSVVMPTHENRLREQLIRLEEAPLRGLTGSVQVRTLFSYNPEVTAAAKENNLSVGRQMLYNQARARHMNYDEEDIRGSGLGELVGTLLQSNEHDQTDMAVARKAGNPTETIDPQETNSETNRETERETQRETTGTRSDENEATQATNRETERETNRETTGSRSDESEPVQATNQETNRETNRETTSEPSEIIDDEETGTQITNQETHRETKKETDPAQTD